MRRMTGVQWLWVTGKMRKGEWFDFFYWTIGWFLVDLSSLINWQTRTFCPWTSHERRNREYTIHIAAPLLKECKKQNADTQYRSFLTKDGVVDIDEQGWGTFTCFANDVQVWVKVNETTEMPVASDEAEEVVVSSVVWFHPSSSHDECMSRRHENDMPSPWHRWLFAPSSHDVHGLSSNRLHFTSLPLSSCSDAPYLPNVLADWQGDSTLLPLCFQTLFSAWTPQNNVPRTFPLLLTLVLTFPFEPSMSYFTWCF